MYRLAGVVYNDHVVVNAQGHFQGYTASGETKANAACVTKDAGMIWYTRNTEKEEAQKKWKDDLKSKKKEEKERVRQAAPVAKPAQKKEKKVAVEEEEERDSHAESRAQDEPASSGSGATIAFVVISVASVVAVKYFDLM